MVKWVHKVCVYVIPEEFIKFYWNSIPTWCICCIASLHSYSDMSPTVNSIWSSESVLSIKIELSYVIFVSVLCKSVKFRLKCVYYFSVIYHLYFLKVWQFFSDTLFFLNLRIKAIFFSLPSIHSAFHLRSMPLILSSLRLSRFLFSLSL